MSCDQCAREKILVIHMKSLLASAWILLVVLSSDNYLHLSKREGVCPTQLSLLVHISQDQCGADLSSFFGYKMMHSEINVANYVRMLIICWKCLDEATSFLSDVLVCSELVIIQVLPARHLDSGSQTCSQKVKKQHTLHTNTTMQNEAKYHSSKVLFSFQTEIILGFRPIFLPLIISGPTCSGHSVPNQPCGNWLKKKKKQPNMGEVWRSYFFQLRIASLAHTLS